MADWEAKADKVNKMKERKAVAAAAKACGGGTEQLADDPADAFVPSATPERERLPAE
jgi:hypothetical protein